MRVRAIEIPTDEPESDGTLEWDSTGRRALHTAEMLAMALDQAANRIPAQVA